MPTTYLSPGVYVEEVDAGPKPIEGVATAVAAFVGFAQKGPVNEATLVTNWSQFVSNFGEFMAGSYLAHSVFGYFNNGGDSSCSAARCSPSYNIPPCREKCCRASWLGTSCSVLDWSIRLV